MSRQAKAINSGKSVNCANRQKERGGRSSQLYGLFPVVMIWHFSLGIRAQRKETPSEAAETDATKPLFGGPFSLTLLFLHLAMQVIFFLESVLISFTVCGLSSLAHCDPGTSGIAVPESKETGKKQKRCLPRWLLTSGCRDLMTSCTVSGERF